MRPPISRKLILLAAGATAISALSSEPATAAQQRCQDNIVCMEERETRGGTELLAINRASFPVSVSVYARVRNLQVEPGRSLSRTLEARQTIRLLTLNPRSPGRPTSLRYWFDWSPGVLKARHQDGYLYRLPYASGESFRVLQGYGSRFSHQGDNRYAVDFKMPVGTPVYAARGGRVVKTESRHSKGCWEKGCGKYANYIVILHDDGTTGEYYHLRRNGVLVANNELVEPGQHIGYSGNTGHTTTPHLHFAVYRPRPWSKFESLPVRFRSRSGIVSSPRRGGRYVAD